MNNTKDSRLNAMEVREIARMKFVCKHLGEACYEAAMYDRPKFWMSDSPVSRGTGKTIHEAKIDAFISWSRS